MATDTMTAVRMHEFGPPAVLRPEEVPIPGPGPGELLIRVRAIGLNPPDWYVREGMPGLPPHMRPPLTFPVVPGTDVSGEVAALGPGVSGFSLGDEVFGMLRFPGPGGDEYTAGAYAEYVTAPASDVARKPAGVDHVAAAGSAMSGLTAWQFLIDVGHDHPSPFQEAPHRPVPLDGARVLVNGAAGGVGHLGLQLATWRGAHVIAVASGRHEAFVRELGAAEFVDYTLHRPEDVVADLDLVLDCVGGDGSSRFLPALRRGGALFPVFFADVDADEVARLGVTVSGTQVRANGAQVAELATLLDAGTLRVGIDSTFPLTEAAAAHEHAAHGHLQGKIVLTVA